MLLTEAAGFDVAHRETVGIGQSETTVADMTDFFLVLMLPGAGDQLQGLKKVSSRLADTIAMNKADGDNASARARRRPPTLVPHCTFLFLRSPNWHGAGRHLLGTPPAMALPPLGSRVLDHRAAHATFGEWDSTPARRAARKGCGR